MPSLANSQTAYIQPDHSDFLVCICCSRKFKFSSRLIAALAERQAVLLGYQPLEHKLTLSGICSECQTDSSFNRIEAVQTDNADEAS